MIDFPPDQADRTVHPYRPALQQFTAFVLRDGRRAGLCWDEKPRCVHGHRLKTRDPQQLRDVRLDALLTCIHRGDRNAAPCDTRQYVALNTFGGSANVKGTGERFWLVVEVTDEHVRHMRAQPMIFLERMSLLSCVLPGVDMDLAGAPQDDDATGSKGDQ